MHSKRAKAMFAMKRALPKGIITQWYGSIASIPAGWALCNGDNDTPDLRDRFIVGAKEDEGGIAKTNVSGALTQTGGDKNHKHTFTGNGHFHSCEIGMGTEGGVAHSVVTDTVAAVGTTDNGSTLAPYYALAYIMKL